MQDLEKNFLYILKRVIGVLKPLCTDPCVSCKQHLGLCTSILDTVFLQPGLCCFFVLQSILLANVF